MQSKKADQSCVVRPEARAREFVVVARLILSRKKPQRKQVSAFPLRIEGEHVIVLVTDTRPESGCDLGPSKAKPSFRGVEA